MKQDDFSDRAYHLVQASIYLCTYYACLAAALWLPTLDPEHAEQASNVAMIAFMILAGVGWEAWARTRGSGVPVAIFSGASYALAWKCFLVSEHPSLADIVLVVANVITVLAIAQEGWQRG